MGLSKKQAFGISMGVLWAVTYSTAMHDVVLGISMGVLMALVFGYSDDDGDDDDE